VIEDSLDDDGAFGGSGSEVSGTGSVESGIRSWAGDLQVNRQASLCDEFGGAQSSKWS
jgi:hypothetical protein